MKEVNVGGTKMMVSDLVEIETYADFETGAKSYTVDANCVMSDGKLQTQYRGNKINTIAYLQRNFRGQIIKKSKGENKP
ncbi:MAG: hypothetical protein WC433_07120 [Candidatus Omnitrophota bacterium]